MAKDKRDEKTERDPQQEGVQESERLELEREQLAEKGVELATLKGQLETEGQRLSAERQELDRQWAELRAAQAPLMIDEPEPIPADTPVSGSGHVIMHVLRKFRFQYPVVTNAENITPGAERWFEKGDNLLDPRDPNDAFVLNHSWIKDDLADGRIEHPQSTMDRLKSLAEQAKHRASANQAAIRQAENALLQHASFSQNDKAAADAFLKEMNTPIHLRGKP